MAQNSDYFRMAAAPHHGLATNAESFRPLPGTKIIVVISLLLGEALPMTCFPG
jgi:hypothetical protein